MAKVQRKKREKKRVGRGKERKRQEGKNRIIIEWKYRSMVIIRSQMCSWIERKSASTIELLDSFLWRIETPKAKKNRYIHILDEKSKSDKKITRSSWKQNVLGFVGWNIRLNIPLTDCYLFGSLVIYIKKSDNSWNERRMEKKKCWKMLNDM